MSCQIINIIIIKIYDLLTNISKCETIYVMSKIYTIIYEVILLICHVFYNFR